MITWNEDNCTNGPTTWESEDGRFDVIKSRNGPGDAGLFTLYEKLAGGTTSYGWFSTPDDAKRAAEACVDSCVNHENAENRKLRNVIPPLRRRVQSLQATLDVRTQAVVERNKTIERLEATLAGSRVHTDRLELVNSSQEKTIDEIDHEIRNLRRANGAYLVKHRDLVQRLDAKDAALDRLREVEAGWAEDASSPAEGSTRIEDAEEWARDLIGSWRSSCDRWIIELVIDGGGTYYQLTDLEHSDHGRVTFNSLVSAQHAARRYAQIEDDDITEYQERYLERMKSKIKSETETHATKRGQPFDAIHAGKSSTWAIQTFDGEHRSICGRWAIRERPLDANPAVMEYGLLELRDGRREFRGRYPSVTVAVAACDAVLASQQGHVGREVIPDAFRALVQRLLISADVYRSKVADEVRNTRDAKRRAATLNADLADVNAAMDDDVVMRCQQAPEPAPNAPGGVGTQESDDRGVTGGETGPERVLWGEAKDGVRVSKCGRWRIVEGVEEPLHEWQVHMPGAWVGTFPTERHALDYPSLLVRERRVRSEKSRRSAAVVTQNAPRS